MGGWSANDKEGKDEIDLVRGKLGEKIRWVGKSESEDEESILWEREKIHNSSPKISS